MNIRRVCVISIPIFFAAMFAAGCGNRTASEQPAPEAAQKAADQPAAERQAAEPAAQPAERPAAQPQRRAGRRTAETAPPATPRGAAAEAARRPEPIVLEAGTVLKVRTTSTISTKTHAAGDVFEASLAEPVVVGGRQVLPRGAAVTGRVVDSDPGGRVKGVASLSLALTSIASGGAALPVSTNSVSQQAQSSKKKDAAKVGIGAGIGAAIGAIAGGGKGAAVGAAAGGGAGTAAVLATRGEAATVPAETVLAFELTRPLKLQ